MLSVKRTGIVRAREYWTFGSVSFHPEPVEVISPREELSRRVRSVEFSPRAVPDWAAPPRHVRNGPANDGSARRPRFDAHSDRDPHPSVQNQAYQPLQLV